MKIMIVDDDPTVLALLVRMLEAGGYKALPCETAEIGLGFIHSEDVDVVLTDVHMPVMTGTDLIARLVATAPKLPVIAMSGSFESAGISPELCKGLGAVGILRKPLTGRELFAMIDQVACR